MSVTSISGYVDTVLAQHPTSETLFLDFGGGYVTRLDSNSRALVDKLKDYFRDFLAQGEPSPTVTIHAIEAPDPVPSEMGVSFNVKQPDPGKTKIKEEWADFADGRFVRKRTTGMLFAFGAGKHLAVGPCIANDNQVVNFINNRFIEWTLDSGSLLYHAAGVTQNGKGISLAGFSGAGKSTLALHIMNLGTDFVSNDRLMVKREDEGLTMYGVAKMPRINPGTILNNPSLRKILTPEEDAQFSGLPLEELWDLEYKYDGFIDELYGPNKFKLVAPMTGVVLLNWRREDGGELKMEQIDIAQRRDLMPAFMKSTGLFYGPGKDMDDSEEAHLKLLGDTPVYEFTGTIDFEKAADICLDLLK